MCLIGPGGEDIAEYSRYSRTQCTQNLHWSGIPESLCHHLATWGSRRWKLEPKNSHCMRPARDQWVLEMLLCLRKSRSTLNQTGSSKFVCYGDPINPHYINALDVMFGFRLYSFSQLSTPFLVVWFPLHGTSEPSLKFNGTKYGNGDPKTPTAWELELPSVALFGKYIAIPMKLRLLSD